MYCCFSTDSAAKQTTNIELKITKNKITTTQQICKSQDKQPNKKQRHKQKTIYKQYTNNIIVYKLCCFYTVFITCLLLCLCYFLYCFILLREHSHCHRRRSSVTHDIISHDTI